MPLDVKCVRDDKKRLLIHTEKENGFNELTASQNFDSWKLITQGACSECEF